MATDPIGSTGVGPLPATVSSFRDCLTVGNGGQFWFLLSVGLGLISALTYEIKVFSYPADAISNDARMFLSWMGRWNNEALLDGDFVADYWRAISPWAFTGLFRAAWGAGIQPLVFAKIFPAILFVAVAVYTFRFVRAIGGEPLIGFLVTAAVLHYLGHANLIVTSTPRAFWPLLLLVMLDGLARDRIFQTALAQLLLTGTYPQLAMATATMIGLTLLTFSPRPVFDLNRRRILLVAVCALATICGIVPFLLNSGAYSPSFSLTEALQIPTFGPLGRGALFPPDGRYNLLCGSRLSFLIDCNGGALIKPFFVIVTAFGAAVILFVRTLRPANDGRMASKLPLLLALSSILWFLLARTVLFRLHLPNRYTAATELLLYLTALALILEWIRRFPLPEQLLRSNAGRRLFLGVTVAVLLISAAGAANVRVVLTTPDPAFLTALRALPEKAVVGGFVEDLDFSPVLTNRSTLFSRELAIAYQKGYFLPIMARMEAIKDMVLTNDPAVLVGQIKNLKLTHLAIRQADIGVARVPEEFRGFFDEKSLEKDEETARLTGTLLAKLAPNCVSGTYGGVSLVLASCIVSSTQIASSH